MINHYSGLDHETTERVVCWVKFLMLFSKRSSLYKIYERKQDAIANNNRIRNFRYYHILQNQWNVENSQAVFVKSRIILLKCVA